MPLFDALVFADVPAGAIFVIVLLVMTLLMVVLGVATFSALRPWMMAMMAGCPLSLPKLLGMRMRGVNAAKVIRCGVMTQQAGFPIGWDELERAALMGVDLEKVTLAYIKAQREDLGFAFGDLVDADRDQRLASLLEQGR